MSPAVTINGRTPVSADRAGGSSSSPASGGAGGAAGGSSSSGTAGEKRNRPLHEQQQQQQQSGGPGRESGQRQRRSESRDDEDPACASSDGEGDGEGSWLDWFGTSCQSAYDAILLPGVGNDLDDSSSQRQQQQQLPPSHARPNVKIRTTRTTGLGGRNGGSSTAQDGASPASSAASCPPGAAPGMSAVEAARRKSSYKRAQTAPPPAVPGLFVSASDDMSDKVKRTPATVAAARAGSGTGAGGAGSGGAAGGASRNNGRVRRANSTITDSIGQTMVMAGIRFNRSRSDYSDSVKGSGGGSSKGGGGGSVGRDDALSPAATVAEVAAAAATAAERQAVGSGGIGGMAPFAAASPEIESRSGAEPGVRLSSLLPPLPTRGAGGKSRDNKKAGESWTTLHDRLIEELFEEQRRALREQKHAANQRAHHGHHGHGHGNDGGDGEHHHHYSPFPRGFKIGNLLPHHHHHGSADGNDKKDEAKASPAKGSRKSPTKASKKKDAAAAAEAAPEQQEQQGILHSLPIPVSLWGSTPAKAPVVEEKEKRRFPRLRKLKVRKASSSNKASKSLKRKLNGSKAKKRKAAAGGNNASSDSQTKAATPGKKKDGADSSSSSTAYSFLRVPSLARLSPARIRRPAEDSHNHSVASSAPGGVAAAGGGGSNPSSPRVTFGYTGSQEPNPGSYLNAKCRLQKDKGTGEVPGTAVSTVGREKALAKLREKVDVIVEVEQSSSAAASKAKLKLKPAVLVDPWVTHASFKGTVETRSVIAVKMGFLSMKYGILLRWDVESGLVNLIVLRKMCPPGFLDGSDGPGTALDDSSMDGSPGAAADKARGTVEADAAAGGAARAAARAPSTPPSRPLNPSPTKKKKTRDASSSSAIKSKPGIIISRLVDGANAVLHGRWDSDANAGETEVALLGPPYRVERPDRFPDATLSVTVLRARGLCGGDNKRADWVLNPYVRLSVGYDSHKTGAVKMTCNPTWGQANRNSCRLKSSNNPKEDDQHLKVEVYDWRPFRRDRILGVVFVPVASVEPQKDDGKTRKDIQATEVSIPVRMMRNKKGPYGCVTLSLVHRNAYWCWLREELKARGKELTR